MPMKWTPKKDQLVSPNPSEPSLHLHFQTSKLTPSYHLQLLLKILETNNNLSVDFKKVAEAWPVTPNQDRPTPRAISERLVKIRQMAKSSAANTGSDGHLSIGKGVRGSASSTPRKSTKASVISTPEWAKRKRSGNGEMGFPVKKEVGVKDEVVNEDEDYGEDELECRIVETPTKKMKGLELSETFTTRVGYHGQGQVEVRAGSTLNLKKEKDDDDDVFGASQPAKRQIRARRATAPFGMVNYGDALGEDEDEDRADDAESSASDYVPEGIEVDRDDEFA
ncbi:hypothetical protein BDV12DRAFT_193079 [Aspergillus spectabilis]